jgi:hypothetical protein
MRRTAGIAAGDSTQVDRDLCSLARCLSFPAGGKVGHAGPALDNPSAPPFHTSVSRSASARTAVQGIWLQLELTGSERALTPPAASLERVVPSRSWRHAAAPACPADVEIVRVRPWTYGYVALRWFVCAAVESRVQWTERGAYYHARSDAHATNTNRQLADTRGSTRSGGRGRDGSGGALWRCWSRANTHLT